MAELNEIANRIHDQVAGVNRVSLFPASAQRIIESIDTITYIGISAPGTAQATEKSWFIEKVVSGDTTTTITHATDSWSNRASASYS